MLSKILNIMRYVKYNFKMQVWKKWWFLHVDYKSYTFIMKIILTRYILLFFLVPVQCIAIWFSLMLKKNFHEMGGSSASADTLKSMQTRRAMWSYLGTNYRSANY